MGLGPGAVMTDAQKLKFATGKDILMKDWSYYPRAEGAAGQFSPGAVYCNQRGHISRDCTNAMVQDMSTGAGLIVPPAPMGGH